MLRVLAVFVRCVVGPSCESLERVCESHKCEMGACVLGFGPWGAVHVGGSVPVRPCAVPRWSVGGRWTRGEASGEAEGGATSVGARARRANLKRHELQTHAYPLTPTHTRAHAHTQHETTPIWKHVRPPCATRQTGKRIRLCARRHTLPRAPARLARETARVAAERLPLPELHGVIDYKLRFVPDVGIDATHEDVQQPIARHAHLRPR